MPINPHPGASSSTSRQAALVDSPEMRRAGRELLSVALIGARNRTLQLLSAFDDASAGKGWPDALPAGRPAPLWLVGHIGWFAEYWIGRNTQRAFGIDCSNRPTRLASIEPRADGWWRAVPDGPRGDLGLDIDQTRAYLLETLESTLELLENAAETDAGLYFYRLALFHEDLRGEQLIETAQAVGLPLAIDPPAAMAVRDPLALPATRWTVGHDLSGGFVFAQESGSTPLEVPEFEIDAQPVTWGQFTEFVADGGYDRAELWHPEGRAWLARQTEGRRAPRYVEQIGAARPSAPGGAVLRQRFGARVQAAQSQSAIHLSWWEADAWARWAGRRLATEVEWEIAAHTAMRRGFRWGEVQEWTAGTLKPWPGFAPDPWSEGSDFDPQPGFGQARVLRGASFATPGRLRSPKRRGFAPPGQDEGFYGFRTCAF